MKRRIWAVGVLGLFGLVGSAHADGDASPERAAQRAIESTRAMTGRAAQIAGISGDSVSKARFGTPFRLLMVRLDMLRDYQAGQDPASLLVETGESILPVLVDDTVTSAVRVLKTKDGWRTTRIGEVSYVRALEPVRQQARKARRGSADSDYFVVEILGLQMSFIAHASGGNLELRPVVGRADLSVNASDVFEAGALFARLAPVAKAALNVPIPTPPSP